MKFSVFKKINKLAGRWKVLDWFAVFCARYLPYLLVVFLFLFCLVNYSARTFAYALAAGALGRFMNEIVHFFYKEQRPAQLEGTNVLIPAPTNLSFPSGHTSFFFGLSIFLLLESKNLGAPIGVVFLTLSLIIGIARVFCGVHWFRDILGGITVGLISSSIIFYFINL